MKAKPSHKEGPVCNQHVYFYSYGNVLRTSYIIQVTR